MPAARGVAGVQRRGAVLFLLRLLLLLPRPCARRLVGVIEKVADGRQALLRGQGPSGVRRRRVERLGGERGHGAAVGVGEEHRREIVISGDRRRKGGQESQNMGQDDEQQTRELRQKRAASVKRRTVNLGFASPPRRSHSAGPSAGFLQPVSGRVPPRCGLCVAACDPIGAHVPPWMQGSASPVPYVTTRAVDAENTT